MSGQTFLSAYIECALWSSTDNDELFPDDCANESDMHAETLAAMQEECINFQTEARQLLAKAYTVRGYGEAQAGHDFWLTRNGHGAGFWDRGLGDVGEALSDIARQYGPVNLWVDENEEIRQHE